MFQFYQRVKEVTPTRYSDENGQWFGVPLEPGSNDIGILFLRTKTHKDQADTLEFDSFYRFTVVLDGTEETVPSTAPTGVATDLQGIWQFYTEQLIEVKGSESTMDYVHSLFANYGNKPTFSGGPTYSSLEDYIVQSNSGYTRELISTEKRYLEVFDNGDGTYRAEYRWSDMSQNPMRTVLLTQFQSSGNTITFVYSDTEYPLRFDLTINNGLLSGTMTQNFYHPYMSFDDTYEWIEDPNDELFGGYSMVTVDNTPEGYDAVEVRTCELVRADPSSN